MRSLKHFRSKQTLAHEIKIIVATSILLVAMTEIHGYSDQFYSQGRRQVDNMYELTTFITTHLLNRA